MWSKKQVRGTRLENGRKDGGDRGNRRVAGGRSRSVHSERGALTGVRGTV